MDNGKQHANTSQLVQRFLDLLDDQLPVQRTHYMERRPSYYAESLKVHVNYLNRVLKRHLGRTTTQIISDSVFKEAKRLLRETPWSITEIAFALGFSEPNHFSHFFKKREGQSPVQFRGE
ncbi:MAG: helix-turn-helix transcriptional regulator [Bacteroidota bacterium]|nr:helix-turn-helix transcriptional regulator [Bacteroidota bacterium]